MWVFQQPAKTRSALVVFSLVALAGAAAGCSTSNLDSPMSFVGPDGRHSSGWQENHGTLALPDGSTCGACHGEALGGGISGVSCFLASRDGSSCHPQGPAFHPASWLDKDARGTPDWHATAYSTGQTIRTLGCADCHTPPSLDGTGGWCRQCHFDITGNREPGTGYVHGQISGHSDTPSFDEEVCVLCHQINNRFGHGPFCHNCHGPFPGQHPDGWSDSGAHGAAAKTSPGAATGFAFCQLCHGEDFAGGTHRSCAGTGCHGVVNTLTLPHPSRSRWRGESPPTHTSTARGNAPVCFACHEDGANSDLNPSNPPPDTPPGCFNGTLCHYNAD